MNKNAILLVFLLTAPGYTISDSAGTKNGNFLKIATDARGVALGDSIVSMVKGADSLRWNAAALGNLDSKEVSATHVEYYQDVRVENVSAVFPFDEGGFGVSLFYLSPGTLDGRTVSGDPTGDFKFYDFVGTLGAGRKMLSRAEGVDVSLGATLKLVRETIADQTFQNPAFDIGALISPKDELNIGLNMRNLASGKANFAREMTGGLSYTFFRVFTGAFAVNYSNDAPLRYSVGGEYKVQELGAALRAGYRSHDSLDSSLDSQIPALRGASVAGLTMGVGMGYKPPILPGVRLDLDYGMAPFGALGISHTVTVKAKW